MKKILFLLVLFVLSCSKQEQEVAPQKEKSREEIIKEIIEKKFNYPKWLEGKWIYDATKEENKEGWTKRNLGWGTPAQGFLFEKGEIYKLSGKNTELKTNIKEDFIHNPTFQYFQEWERKFGDIDVYTILSNYKNKNENIGKTEYSFHIKDGYLLPAMFNYFSHRYKKVE